MRSLFNRETKELKQRIPSLAPETEEALAKNARENNRTLDEEAENIIKTHLANAAGNAD